MNNGGGRKGTSNATNDAMIIPHLVFEVGWFEEVLINSHNRTEVIVMRGMIQHTASYFLIREDRFHNKEDDQRDGAHEGESNLTNKQTN